LDVWFEVNKILTPDQQKEWRAMLRHRVSMRERWNGARGMRGHNFHRPFSPRRGMGMEDREMPKHGMPEHDMPQHEQE